MILKNLFKRKQYLGWNAYVNKINFIDDFYWQQSVRRQNIKNL